MKSNPKDSRDTPTPFLVKLLRGLAILALLLSIFIPLWLYYSLSVSTNRLEELQAGFVPTQSTPVALVNQYRVVFYAKRHCAYALKVIHLGPLLAITLWIFSIIRLKFHGRNLEEATGQPASDGIQTKNPDDAAKIPEPNVLSAGG